MIVERCGRVQSHYIQMYNFLKGHHVVQENFDVYFINEGKNKNSDFFFSITE